MLDLNCLCLPDNNAVGIIAMQNVSMMDPSLFKS